MKKIKIFIIIIVVALVTTLTYNHYFHKDVKDRPMKYCYQTYFGKPNHCLMITNLEFADSLISYYKKMETGENPIFNFPIKQVPIDNPVYVLSYVEDSLLVEIISYRSGKYLSSSYDRGYVYINTLHDYPSHKIIH